ncbi:MAG: DUF4276 family protein [Burkholderiaceae bacterium]|nr:DUF4276 family protein [Burkholderiaceae bacterium]
MRLYTIVEGQGEVAAVPVLLRRLLHDHAQCFGVQPAPPIRRKAHEFRREETVRAAVALAVSQPDCGGVLLLFDGEDDCPAEQGAQVLAWARAAARGVPCEVVLAYREYETWFLAALESLRGQCLIARDAEAPPDSESRRDAKGALEEHMPRGASYSPTVHQGRLSAAFDLALAYRRNRSFRKLTKAVGELLLQMHQPLADWPPAAWRT